MYLNLIFSNGNKSFEPEDSLMTVLLNFIELMITLAMRNFKITTKQGLQRPFPTFALTSILFIH